MDNNDEEKYERVGGDYSYKNYNLNRVILCIVFTSVCMNVPIMLNAINNLCTQYVPGFQEMVIEWLKR